MVQAQHQLVSTEAVMDRNDLVDVQAICQDQGHNDQDVIDTVRSCRNPSTDQAKYHGDGTQSHHDAN